MPTLHVGQTDAQMTSVLMVPRYALKSKQKHWELATLGAREEASLSSTYHTGSGSTGSLGKHAPSKAIVCVPPPLCRHQRDVYPELGISMSLSELLKMHREKCSLGSCWTLEEVAEVTAPPLEYL